jgi:hypothetical protein
VRPARIVYGHVHAQTLCGMKYEVLQPSECYDELLDVPVVMLSIA